MSTLRRALGNSSIMLISQVLTWTSTLILTSALGSQLGGKGFGDLYLAMSFVSISGVLVDFGLHQHLVRSIARDRELASTYLSNAILIKLVLFSTAYAGTLLIIELLNYPAELQSVIAVYSLVLLFYGISGSLTAVYQASEHVLYPAIAGILEKMFIAAAAIFLLSQGYGVFSVALVYVATGMFTTFWLLFFLRKVIRVRFALNLKMLRGLAAAGLPFLVYNVLSTVYYRLDIVLLSKLTDQSVVGWYGAAYRLFDTLSFLPGIVSGVVMFPILSRLSVQSRDNLRYATRKGLDVILILGIPICVGLFVLAEPIIELIYRREEFRNAVTPLRWLAVCLVLLYVNYMLTVVIWSLNKERKMVLCAGLAGVLNLGLNWTFIPAYGQVAAAGATVATELFVMCYVLAIMPKELLSVGTLVVFAKASVAAGTMALVLYLLAGQNLLLLIPVGAAVYCASGLLIGLVPMDDLRLIRQAVAGRPGREAVEAAAP